MRCSVVILNWNGEQILHKFLPSVIAFSALEDCEVVVADNCSTDNSIAILKQYPSVRLIQLDKNYGFAEGYNRAIQQIDSQYIVLLNSDVEVTESWLKTMLDFADNNPEVVAVQPKILS
ncbi:MAG: glycosyltransferase, partial [Paludibacteraceae bacterium]|nr:glycosyltransferase [Paludibacteraceae bacterium]